MPCSKYEVFTADLHIHSVLSPCAEREMLPACIILEAVEKKVDIIAICDHNGWENVGTVVSLGKRFGVWVIPGIEVETQEEVHLLCYFPTVNHLCNFSTVLSRFLPRIPLREDLWGEEWVVNEVGEIVEKKDYLLVHPVNLSVEEVSSLVNFYGGVIIPAHVDRINYSIVSQLGFIPSSLGISVIEVSSQTRWEDIMQRFELREFRPIRSSDAHALCQIGKGITHFSMVSLQWSEFLLALSSREGRNFFID